MAAPTGSLDTLDIQTRLEGLLGDEAPPPEKQENSQATKEELEVQPPVEKDDTQEGDEPLLADDAESKEPALKQEEATEEGGEIQTLSDLAKMFEVEETEMLDQLQVDDGRGNTVNLSDVLTSYRQAPEAVQRYEEMKAQQIAFQAEAAALRERTDNSMRDLAVNAQALLDITTEDFKDINWKALEVEDPQQYLILKNKQSERGAVIQGAINKLKAAEQQRITDLQASGGKDRQTEVAALHRQMPAWSDPAVAQVAMADTQQFLAASAFSPEEINAISDHRYLLVAWKASQFDKLQKNAPKKLAKLKSLPKPKNVLRAGARREASGDTRKQAQKNFDRLKETGDERDAARLFEELL
jgi:hypothetical protein